MANKYTYQSEWVKGKDCAPARRRYAASIRRALSPRYRREIAKMNWPGK